MIECNRISAYGVSSPGPRKPLDGWPEPFLLLHSRLHCSHGTMWHSEALAVTASDP